MVYQSDVYAASNVHIGSPRRHARSSWGGRAVLVLIGIRLGIDGVNPIYYQPIKVSSIMLALGLHMRMNPLAGAVHVPPVRRYRGGASLFLVLLYGLSGR